MRKTKQLSFEFQTRHMYNEHKSKSGALGVAVAIENLRIQTALTTSSKNKTYQDTNNRQNSLKKSSSCYRSLNRTKTDGIPPNLK